MLASKRALNFLSGGSTSGTEGRISGSWDWLAASAAESAVGPNRRFRRSRPGVGGYEITVRAELELS